MLPCHLVQAAHTEFMSMKTHRVLNRSTKCANVHYRKIQFYHLFTIKTKKIQHTILKTFTEKNSLQKLTKFHGGLFYLKIVEIFTAAFSLKLLFKLEFFQVP